MKIQSSGCETYVFKKESFSDMLWNSMKKVVKQIEKGKQKSVKDHVITASVQEVVSILGNMYSKEEIMGELTSRNNSDDPIYEGILKPETILNLN